MEEIFVEDLIATLDVEEKAKAKDAFIEKKTTEKKYKSNKPSFKKKKIDKKDLRDIIYFMCKKDSHMVTDCHFCNSRDGEQPKKKVVKMIRGEVWTSESRGFLYPHEKQVTCFYSWCWHSESEAYFEEDCPHEDYVACSYSKQEHN